jgi:hypothetical protein
VSVSANVTGGNLLTGGLISATGNISGGNVIVTGIVVDNTANLDLQTTATNGNINLITAGTGIVATAASFSATGNITGGNILTGGLISATGNITGGNVLGGANVNATTHTGTTVSVTANITGGNLLTGGLISATGNVSGGNLNVTGNIVDTGALSIVTGGNGNIALAPDGSGIVTASGAFSAVGNITGGNLAIVGNTATITTANISIGYLNIPQISLSANVTANLTVSGKHYYSTSASNLALTLADNSAVSWPVGTAISVINRGTANVTVAPAAGVSLYLAGNSTSANRVVTTYGMATVMNVAANIWMINGTVV